MIVVTGMKEAKHHFITEGSESTLVSSGSPCFSLPARTLYRLLESLYYFENPSALGKYTLAHLRQLCCKQGLGEKGVCLYFFHLESQRQLSFSFFFLVRESMLDILS